MLRYCNAILLSFVYILVVFQSIIPIIDYQINKKKISEILCINKYEITKVCRGHCYLNKQIAKAEESNIPASIPFSNGKVTIQDITLNHLPENIFFLHKFILMEKAIFHTDKKTLLYNQYTFSIFHPPIV